MSIFSLAPTFTLMILVGLMGCASPAVKSVSEPEVDLSEIAEPPLERVDIGGLERSLGMQRPADQLGYAEKVFNTCQAGYGYSPTHNCRAQHLVVMHFRLQCRDSEGTVTEVTNAELRPVTVNRLRWHLGRQYGYVATDGEGFGQLRTTTSGSQRQQRIRLTINNDFLTMTAGQMKRVIVPKSWCTN